METEHFDFNDHLPSVEWIQDLPNGFLTNPIDLRYRHVTITKLNTGYEVYVGPKDPDKGGDALVVTLDEKFKLVGHYIERLEPPPEDLFN